MGVWNGSLDGSLKGKRIVENHPVLGEGSTPAATSTPWALMARRSGHLAFTFARSRCR